MVEEHLPIEQRMTAEELQRAVRRCWDDEFAIADDFRDVPEVPSRATLLMLSEGGYPFFWEAGKQEQRRLPYGSVPWKTELEIGMGRWKFIRDALRAAQNPSEINAA